MKIPIFTDDPGWHGNALQQSFAAQGVEAIFVPLNSCLIHINNSQNSAQPAIVIPQFESALPKAVFVRGVSGGTLQQVITRLNFLHMLQQLGVMVYNQGRAIERTVDKAMTSFLLQQHGVNTPQTWICESRQQIAAVRASVNAPLVLKPLFGSQGVGVQLLQQNAPLPVPMQQYVEGVYYLQQHIKTAEPSHDYRVFVINQQVVATMRRSATQASGLFVNNVSAGAVCSAVEAPLALVDIALNAAKAVNIDYCGVDVIQAENGEYYVLEVNSIPAWRGLQSVSQTNIADALVQDFLQKCSI